MIVIPLPHHPSFPTLVLDESLNVSLYVQYCQLATLKSYYKELSCHFLLTKSGESDMLVVTTVAS